MNIKDSIHYTNHESQNVFPENLHESQNVFTEKFRPEKFRQFHVNFINLLVRRTNKFVENENRKESLGYVPLRKGNP